MAKREKPGQPTKYKAEYCDLLYKHMSEGFSFESFGPSIGVHRDTLYEWCTKHVSFSDAKKKAVDAALLFWETKGIEGMCGKIPFFNSNIWIFSMKNRFKWHDNVHVEEKTEAKIKIDRDPASMTDEELVEYYKKRTGQ